MGETMIYLLLSLVFAGQPNCTDMHQSDRNCTNLHKSAWICTIDTGLGRVKYGGRTQENSMEKTVRSCLNGQIKNFIKLRSKTPKTDRKVLFLEYCLNNTQCWEKK